VAILQHFGEKPAQIHKQQHLSFFSPNHPLEFPLVLFSLFKKKGNKLKRAVESKREAGLCEEMGERKGEHSQPRNVIVEEEEGEGGGR
jgi:hypothetical protein